MFKKIVLYLLSKFWNCMFLLILVLSMNLIFILVKIWWCSLIMFFFNLKDGILNVSRLLIFLYLL